jgi:hypothetical protein
MAAPKPGIVTFKRTTETFSTPFVLATNKHGEPVISFSQAQVLQASVPTGAATVENYPPDQDMAWSLTDLRGGIGQLEYLNEGFYADGSNWDGRGNAQHVKGPEFVSAPLTPIPLTPTGTIGVAAVARAQFLNNLYVGGGRYLFKQNGATMDTVLDVGAGVSITDVVAFNNWLVVAIGGAAGYYYSTDGAVFTQQLGGAKAFADYLTVGESSTGAITLWLFRNPNELRASTDPTNYAGISGIIYVGGTDNNFLRPSWYGASLYMPKEDGVYYFNSSGTVLNSLPEYKQQRAGNNFKVFFVAWFEIYYSAGQALLQWTSAGIPQIDPFRFQNAPNPGIPTAGCFYNNYAYVTFLRADGTTMLYAGRTESLAGGVSWGWNPLLNLGANACNLLFVSELDSGLPKLWMAKGTDFGYIFLSNDPLNASGYRFTTEPSWMITPYYNYRFVDVMKILNRINTRARNLVGGSYYLTFEYQIDQDTSWVPLGTMSLNGTQKIALPRNLQVYRVRFRVFMYGNANTSSPILESFTPHAVLRPKANVIISLTIKLGEGLPRTTMGAQLQKNYLMSLIAKGDSFEFTDTEGDVWEVVVKPWLISDAPLAAAMTVEGTFSMALQTISWEPQHKWDEAGYDNTDVYYSRP